MSLSFKRRVMNFLLDVVVFFKGKNFTILREFDIGGNVKVKEYRYNMGKFLTDVWPPNVSGGSGFPIKLAVRESDGLDVTETVLKFSGPKRNYVHPLSVCLKRKRVRLDYTTFGVLRVLFEDVWEPYIGNVIVTDILGLKKVVHVEYKYSNG
jgi:hypothetical protein